jgi:hypothetical protein
VRLAEVAGAILLTLLASAVPTSTGFLAVRAALVVAALTWFGGIVRSLHTGPDRSAARIPKPVQPVDPAAGHQQRHADGGMPCSSSARTRRW